MNDEFESNLPPVKFWTTELNVSSVKSQYEIKFTLVNPPNNEDEIKKWFQTTFGRSGYIYRPACAAHEYYYAEIFFRNESDATMFVLQWGNSFT